MSKTADSGIDRQQAQSDLNLQEALEQYEAECREVCGGPVSEMMYPCQDCVPQLIGACVVWLRGKTLPALHDNHPEDALRFYLDEVRAHMEDDA